MVCCCIGRNRCFSVWGMKWVVLVWFIGLFGWMMFFNCWLIWCGKFRMVVIICKLMKFGFRCLRKMVNWFILINGCGLFGVVYWDNFLFCLSMIYCEVVKCWCVCWMIFRVFCKLMVILVMVRFVLWISWFELDVGIMWDVNMWKWFGLCWLKVKKVYF